MRGVYPDASGVHVPRSMYAGPRAGEAFGLGGGAAATEKQKNKKTGVRGFELAWSAVCGSLKNETTLSKRKDGSTVALPCPPGK